MKLILVIQLITGRRPHLYSKIKVQLLLSRLLHWLLTRDDARGGGETLRSIARAWNRSEI